LKALEQAVILFMSFENLALIAKIFFYEIAIIFTDGELANLLQYIQDKECLFELSVFSFYYHHYFLSYVRSFNLLKNKFYFRIKKYIIQHIQ
jgi:hypothetical protein